MASLGIVIKPRCEIFIYDNNFKKIPILKIYRAQAWKSPHNLLGDPGLLFEKNKLVKLIK